ncbi:MAG TPA: SCO family protein [Gammaproteobacteria bacterium]|nr:SCO family protein [Gammaproteobacteria bacterium]
MKSRKILAVAAILLLALVAGMRSWRYVAAHRAAPRPQTDAILLQKPLALPAFKLQMVGGVPFTAASLGGHWSLLYFGYTHCPDACPTTLAELNKLMTRLQQAPAAPPPQVYFVSVDPKRDSLEELGSYVRYFNPTFLAATGGLDQVKALTGPLGADFSYGLADKQGNYGVTHAAFVVLVDPGAREAALFMPPLDAARMAADYRKILAYYGAS